MDALSMLTLFVFGFGLGLKHAIEADHLAAVSTIVTQRKNVWGASLVGGLWGVGHTISLLAAGILVIFFHIEISERVEQTLELCVALMLIVLGIDALRRLIRGGQTHLHVHKHEGHTHLHPHTHEPDSTHSAHGVLEHTHEKSKIGLRPVIVGMIHGMAGSGAIMLLVLATISSPGVGLAYILIFGVGSIGGMMLMSLILSLPMLITARRSSLIEYGIGAASGLFSLGLGLFMAYDLSFVKGLII